VYLKDNTSKCDPTGSCKKQALNPAVTKQATKWREAAGARKGKSRWVIQDDDDKEEEEEGDESPGGSNREGNE